MKAKPNQSDGARFRLQETIQRIQSQVDDNETRLQSVDRNQAWAGHMCMSK